MTYHRSVSGYGFSGLASGLGGDPRGDDIKIRFQPGPGFNTTNAQPVFAKLREILSGTQYFTSPINVGWGTGGTFYVSAMVRGNISSAVTLRKIAELMPGIAEDAVAGTGRALSFMGIKNEDDNEYIGASDLAVRTPTQPSSGEGLYTPSKPSGGEQLFTAPPSLPSVTMTVEVLQARLVASGARISVDNRWGNNTKSALERFAGARGITLPTLGVQADYVLRGSDITIPAALASALPVARGGGSGPRPSGSGAGEGKDQGSTVPGDQGEPGDSTDVTRGEYGAATSGSSIPWAWVGAAVGVAALVAVVMLSKRDSASSAEAF